MNSRGKLYGLDHLRALAICFVFLFHYQLPTFGHPDWLVDVAKFGWTGVDLFFVLSGFLIASQLFVQVKLHNRLDFKDFFLKRFFRIIPAYWAVVAIYFCIPFFRERDALPPLWKFLTFTQNFGLDLSSQITFSHAWSLCVEEHFYLLLPLVLILLRMLNAARQAYWVMIVVFLFGFIIRAYSWHTYYEPSMVDDNGVLLWYRYIYYPTYNRLDGLVMGVALAALYHFLPHIWEKVAQLGNWLLVLSVLILTGAYFVCYNEHSFVASVFGFSLVALGYACAVAGAISPKSILYRSNSTITTFIAGLSYSIYLTHKGIIHITQAVLSKQNIPIDSNWMLLFCTVSCIAAALVLNRIIERPFMKLRTKILVTPTPKSG
jgi:peptidoglycan/LPS O-acetylase OafA/YrhL